MSPKCTSPLPSRLCAALFATLFGLSAAAGAQTPSRIPQNPDRGDRQAPSRVDPQVLSRARSACDDAASRAGYRVMRRDRENVNGNAYDLPLHVAYGSNEGDVTCHYDADRGRADIPPYDQQRGFGRREGYPEAYGQAQSLCENYVNNRRGYRVIQVGTPIQHGRNLWDVPITVERRGRRSTTWTCRYNAASNRLSLR